MKWMVFYHVPLHETKWVGPFDTEDQARAWGSAHVPRGINFIVGQLTPPEAPKPTPAPTPTPAKS